MEKERNFLNAVSSADSEAEPSKGASVFEGGKKFKPEDVPAHMAEGMPLEELKQVIDELTETVEYIKANNPADNPDVQHIVDHYNTLKEIYERRIAGSDDREAA